MMLPMSRPGSYGDAQLADGRVEDGVVALFDAEPIELLVLVPLAEVHHEVDAASARGPP